MGISHISSPSDGLGARLAAAVAEAALPLAQVRLAFIDPVALEFMMCGEPSTQGAYDEAAALSIDLTQRFGVDIEGRYVPTVTPPGVAGWVVAFSRGS